MVKPVLTPKERAFAELDAELDAERRATKAALQLAAQKQEIINKLTDQLDKLKKPRRSKPKADTIDIHSLYRVRDLAKQAASLLTLAERTASEIKHKPTQKLAEDAIDDACNGD